MSKSVIIFLGITLLFGMSVEKSTNKMKVRQEPTGAAPAELEKYVVPQLLVFNSLEFGDMLTDHNGMSLYVYMMDKPAESTCYDECAALFPPAILPANNTIIPPEGVDENLIRYSARSDGKNQLLYNNMPLYYFSKDTKPLDINGHEYNNVWFLMSPTGKPIMKNITGGGEEEGRTLETSSSSREIPAELNRNASTNVTAENGDCVNLMGLYFYAENMSNQTLLYDVCCPFGHGLFQCPLYDIDGKLIGMNYLVNSTTFATLPEDEKKMWHSNYYHVKNGLLVPVEYDPKKDLELMNMIADSYGKAYVLLDTAVNPIVPVGAPKLLMSFTKDGQVLPSLLKLRDEILKIKVQDVINNRKSLKEHKLIPGADNWESSGKVIVFEKQDKPMKPLSNASMTNNTTS